MPPPTRKPTLAEGVTFAFEQMMKGRLNTAEPGIIDSYDPETKRARVRLAIKRSFADGRPSEEKATLVDVPIIQPSTGGMMVHLPIKKDDKVMVLFSKEGLANFKQVWGSTEPNIGQYFADAVAFPLGEHNIEPVDPDAIVLQSADGRTSLVIKDGLFEVKVGGRTLRMTPQEGRMT